ncbi:hypothetical protein CF005_24110 [Escherichia coli]|nr:hypothetical protein CF005_24110 [Escherichia coli]
MASVSISCPSCSATDGVVRNGKSTAGHQRYLCSHCRKTWQLQFTYTASQPGTHQKIIDMAMNGVVLQWLLFLSAVPPVQLLTGWCVTAKAPPDISAISALTAVKHGNCSSLTPLLNPVRTRKSLIWP